MNRYNVAYIDFGRSISVKWSHHLCRAISSRISSPDRRLKISLILVK